MKRTLLLLPGDGIGPEVIAEARRVAELLVPISPSTPASSVAPASMSMARRSRMKRWRRPASRTPSCSAPSAARNGRTPQETNAPKPRPPRPAQEARRVRKPAPRLLLPGPRRCLQPEARPVEGLDIMIVRELTGGVYFGQPRGIDETGGLRRGYDTAVYTHPEIERVARVAFDIARGRQSRVCSVEKSNVMESGLFWRQEVTLAHAELGGGVELSHMYADACAMELVRAPKQFDVILADNLFGDILSDAAAMLTGSIGMLPSASLGAPGVPGLYEPVHGSAPDIAGQGVANPCAAILSLEMALRWSLGKDKAADALFAAVGKALDRGARTRDLGGTLNTRQMADAIIAAL